MSRLTVGEDGLGEVAETITAMLPDGGVVVLQGDLASGKTTLVKAVARAFGVEETVTSPTFSLQQCYGDSLYHYDIYNQGFEHFLGLGMMEELEKEGYHLVEWGDEALIDILRSAQIPTIIIEITRVEENRREYEVSHA